MFGEKNKDFGSLVVGDSHLRPKPVFAKSLAQVTVT
jgi:hypothetical protein